MKTIRGVQWYYNLKQEKGLFSHHPRSSLLNKCVVCWDYTDSTHNKQNKLYACFENYLDFAIYFLNTYHSQRCFYEIIFGENFQKPHFDIDMEITKEQIDNKLDKKVLDDFIACILDLFPFISLEKDVCIYTSHSASSDYGNLEKYKRSYHVIINHYCHANNVEAKAFYYTIMSKLPKEYFNNKWIDHAVYSKTQQFRTYNSRKVNTERVKIFLEKWNFQDKEVTHLYDEEVEENNEKLYFLRNLEESLVTARLSNCKSLPAFDTPIEFNKQRQYEKGVDIDYDLAVEAIKMLAESIGLTVDSESFPYSLDKVEGPFVILKRRKASKCRLCNRVHQHQNPYLFITPDGQNVFFHCRRAPANKNLYIGCLKTEENEKEEKNQIEVVKKLDVVIGNVNTIIEEKKHAAMRNTWTENKIKQLKEIAGKSLDNKKTKKVDSHVEDIIVKNMIHKIQQE